MHNSIENKVVIVTGAGSGIGLACASLFFQKGANVVYAVRDKKHTDIDPSVKKSKRAYITNCDVRSEAQVKRLFKKAVEVFGTVDILINSAGVDQPCPLPDITKKHWDYIMNTNVWGVILCCKYAAKVMLKNGYGKIINISSIAGKEGVPYHSAYVASKHAVIGITKCIAQELIKFNINVNAVCPGLIDTKLLRRFFNDYSKITDINADIELGKMVDKTPLQKMGNPSDVANLVYFLCSDESSNIVGQSINTDGGILQH